MRKKKVKGYPVVPFVKYNVLGISRFTHGFVAVTEEDPQDVKLTISVNRSVYNVVLPRGFYNMILDFKKAPIYFGADKSAELNWEELENSNEKES